MGFYDDNGASSFYRRDEAQREAARAEAAQRAAYEAQAAAQRDRDRRREYDESQLRAIRELQGESPSIPNWGARPGRSSASPGGTSIPLGVVAGLVGAAIVLARRGPSGFDGLQWVPTVGVAAAIGFLAIPLLRFAVRIVIFGAVLAALGWCFGPRRAERAAAAHARADDSRLRDDLRRAAEATAPHSNTVRSRDRGRGSATGAQRTR